MSHITGTVQILPSTFKIGPDFTPATNPPNTWEYNFPHAAAPGGTKLLILHFQNVSLPANNRLEVDLGYDTDVFTGSDGSDFWTRPINNSIFPGNTIRIRYITDGAATGGVQIDKYGRGERHIGETGHPSFSNCDPFLSSGNYTEPTYDPFWYCSDPPNWENIACVTNPNDIRTKLAPSIGMIVSVEGNNVSTCSVTLVDLDKVITAGHCHTPEEALTSSVIFNYQVNCDGSKPAGYNARFYKVKAVLKHRWDGTYDYSLLQLATAPPGISALQLRPDIPALGEQIFGIHHPNGAVKKLSIKQSNFDTVLSSNSLAINVHSNFHVSGGSSGSGLFDMSGRIVGVLSHGNPCGKNGLPTPLIYFPTATILKDIAPIAPPPVTRDVMIVFDRSGSMSEDDGRGRSKIEVARDAVSLFIQLVRSGTGNRVGLVSFSTTASRPADFNLADVIPANKNILIGLPPYSGGQVGALTPGGATSIGDGLDQARSQFPSPGVNPRAILLLTDGLQNTPPLVNEVEGALAGIDVYAIGFGSEASLDGSLLNALTSTHGGLYTRAEGTLALEKFFSHAFGNIFEAGVLFDPEYDLPEDQRVSSPQPFNVCGEESITIVVGWDQIDATLRLEVTTPNGTTLSGGSAGIEESIGRTWTFLRLPLPNGSERDGIWNVSVFRPGGGEFPPPAPRLRYFINIIPSGGARLLRAADNRRYYTGDVVNPLVLLRYNNGGWPTDASVQVTVTSPTAGAGNILTQSRLRSPITINGDTIPARQSTLIALEKESDQPLISYIETTFDLSDDSENTNSSFEPAALFGKPLSELLIMEGSYMFHFRATYAQNCTATRELLWSLQVEVGIDPGRTDISTTDNGVRPDGSHNITIVIIPRDKYGNNIGPGKGESISITGGSGTIVSGTVEDNGDGSYTVPTTWYPNSGYPPRVVIDQPGRPCIVVQEAPPTSTQDWTKWKFLFLLLLLAVLILFLLLLAK
jgi:von Willebrand factor type A domain/Trypsin-like peptidase domain